MKRLAVALALTCLAAAPAGVIRHDRAEAAYVRLAQQPQFASVAFVRSTGARGGQVGSAVLVDAQWFVTAAHVVRGATRTTVTLDGEAYRVDRTVLHPHADLALLRVREPVAGVAPAVRYRGRGELHRIATSVGYGVSGHGEQSYNEILARAIETVGTKRAGRNVVDALEDDTILQADFDHPTDARFSSTGSPEALDLEYFAAMGDSGGGLFVEDAGRWVLVGVTTSGETGADVTDRDDWRNAPSYGWTSQWHRVSAFNDWIDRHVAP